MIIIEWIGWTVGICSIVVFGLGIAIGIYIASQIKKSIDKNIKQ
tara:strand:- start:11783 stop:11914 length:132 start_codon:yes stop_codon:yes gene_type:complete